MDGAAGLKLLSGVVPEPARLPEDVITLALAAVELLVLVKVSLSLRAIISAFRRLRAEGGGSLRQSPTRDGPVCGTGDVGSGYPVCRRCHPAVGLHYLLLHWVPAHWHAWVWLLTALGLYLLVWIYADYRAMKLQPHRVRTIAITADAPERLIAALCQ